MNITKVFASVFAAGFFGFGLLCQQAAAIPIAGEISFTGKYTLDNADLALATAFTSFSNVLVSDGTGDYVGTTGASVNYSPFVFDPLAASGVTPLWEFTLGGTAYSFDLLSVSVMTPRNPYFLVLNGSGTANITGFDSTPGEWILSANSFGTTFSFSASNQAHVPEGGATIALLGLALVGVEGLRRMLTLKNKAGA